MTSADIHLLLSLGEGDEREFKSAKGGFPHSFWQTYSAMANSEGGVIILGIEEQDDIFSISGLEHPTKFLKQLWDTANNKDKINKNIFSPADVELVTVEGKTILVATVRKASRRERPIYCGRIPIGHTFRRNFEGDYQCSDDEVGRMLADQSEQPADSQILDGFSLEDLDRASLQQYRQRFQARAPMHPWLSEDDLGLLTKLGAWRRDRNSGKEGLTVAGLLMFGKDDAIRDPDALPLYHVDYQEWTSDSDNDRWTDRLYPDGTWIANLFQFYQLALKKLTQDLKLPFQLSTDLHRHDETSAHEAVREAFVNSIIHADYRGAGGVVIVRTRGGITLSNPGSLLVSMQQLKEGGVSECRNKSLQLMFQMIGGAERAGSGIDKILKGWQAKHLGAPGIVTTHQPERVQCILPFTSLVSEELKSALQNHFGEGFAHLTSEEHLALAIAHLEGHVSGARLRLVSNSHPDKLEQMLRSLESRGFLKAFGIDRPGSFRMASLSTYHPSLFGYDHSIDGASSEKKDTLGNSVVLGIRSTEQPSISLVDEVRRSKRIAPSKIQQAIVELCKDRWLTAEALADALDRRVSELRPSYLKLLISKKELVVRDPKLGFAPAQEYRAVLEQNEQI